MRSDDSSLTPEQLEAVQRAALATLNRADALKTIPVPIEDILEAAKLKVAKYSVFDPRSIAAYIKHAGENAGRTIKSVMGKLLGVLDVSEEIIHIDDKVTAERQTFLKLHETGHFEMPHQRKLFRFFEDSRESLSHEISDLFEREANNFARILMFNGDSFKNHAADMDMGFASVKTLSKAFKASLYASLREYVRTHRLPCVGVILEQPSPCSKKGRKAEVRRVEVSHSYELMFGKPTFGDVGMNDPFGQLVPWFGRVTKPKSFSLNDLNGDMHEFVGEALNTSHQILIFAFPVKALSQSNKIILPKKLHI